MDPRSFRKFVDVFTSHSTTYIINLFIRRRQTITFTLLPIYLQGKRPQHDWLEHTDIMEVLKKIGYIFPAWNRSTVPVV
jgi:hypothetical protein